MTVPQTRPITDEALAALSAGRCDGPNFFLPTGQLDRKLYNDVNKALEALGGKWNRGTKSHRFPEACEPLIESAIETGSYARPSDLGWFATPPDLAKRIVDMADLGWICLPHAFTVLEPSAGDGALVREMDTRHIVTAVELDPGRAARLAGLGITVIAGDFLEWPVTPIFDRVVMNPPFSRRADIHHVSHAFRFLRPGGKLVSIMSASVEFRMDALTVAFRSRCDRIERLPEGSFKTSGTNVSTVVVTMTAPLT